MDKQKSPNDSFLAPINVLMEDQALDSGDEVEEINEAFLCCVCLDLLYKPVVLACGHLSCFWCVHKAMSGLHESYCPICRCPYNHFPTICRLLHCLLLKMYPVAYKRREEEVLEEEKKFGCFSPQFGDHLTSSHTGNELNLLGCPPTSTTMCSQSDSYSTTCSTWKNNPSTTYEQRNCNASVHDNTTTIPEKTDTGIFEATGNVAVEENNFSENDLKDGAWKLISISDVAGFQQQNCNATVHDNTAAIPEKTDAGIFEATRNVAVEENNFSENDLKDGAWKLVSISDVLCAACKQLLYRPAVLNCGHVYCESCIATSMGETLRCQVCQSQHPKGFPKVCLELDHFLEERFSKEYTLRREAVKLKPVYGQAGSPSACATEAGKHGVQSSPSPTKNYFSWLSDRWTKVHILAGCDYCGMYPIIGERYRCKDCVEAIGFDLCGQCYNTPSKLPGRFNQQHTPEHKFELIRSNPIRNTMLKLLPDHSEDGPAGPVLSDDALEDPEDDFSAHMQSDDAPEDPEGTHSTI